MYALLVVLLIVTPQLCLADEFDEIFGSSNAQPNNPQQTSPTAGQPNVPDHLVTEIFGSGPSPGSPDNRVEQKEYPKCRKDGRDGECVPYYLCSNASEIIENGEGLIDIRFSEDKECGHYLDSCCFPADRISPIPNSGNNGNTGGGQLPTTTRTGCGFRNFDGLGFRIKGAQNMESEYGEFPWMTAILSEEEALGKILNVYKCGGSLIHPQVVLTGAHCINEKAPNQLKVRLGEWDTQTTNENFPHVDINVAKKIVHDGFNPRTLANNIGLLILTNPAPAAENIATVCLPPQGAVFDGTRCTASGWGKDKFEKEGQYQVILKKIDLPVVPFPQCQSALRQTRLGQYFKLHESFLCAGGEPGKDTCRGDGGSPLVCPTQQDKSRYYQAGIVSWGIGCGETGTPGVYADVAKFRNWIDLQLNQQGLDAGPYTF